ncbi:DUF2254 domain-containing protein [Marinococcus halotolerans]|uniref:DUF2254 domain-containing protein n=1 Tax=Marinococcus halotolerans TaxID=301092 RepID=UPI0003B5DF04|nr:DUF2254 domain-containing protein [Marinococcus halotolerans]
MPYWFYRLLPAPVKRLQSMSKRQRWHEIRSSLWVVPALYIALAALLAGISYWVEFGLKPGWQLLSAFTTEYQLTETMYSTMLSGILTLNAFTFNSMLMVLTNVSNQFTPRVMLNFISNRKTQHAIGIFNICFFYLLIVFFFLDGSMSQYTVFPIAAVLMTGFSVLNFVLFINHAVKWMQAPSIVNDMKQQSQKRILHTLHEDLESHRAEHPERITHPNHSPLDHEHARTIASEMTGYVQIIDFGQLIEQAKQDGVVVQLRANVGDFVLPGFVLLDYWKLADEGSTVVNERKYRELLFMGDRKTEVQDLGYGVRKLKDIAIKALANDEPGTFEDSLHQMVDLLRSIADVTSFTSYLTDEEGTLRIIMKEEAFEDYLYAAFGHISVYVKKDPVLTNELLKALVLLSGALPEREKGACWHFGKVVAQSFADTFAHATEQLEFYTSLETLSVEARDPDTFHRLIEEFIRNGLLEPKYGRSE